MGRLCAAYKCNNTDIAGKKKDGVTFHAFPVKRPEILRSWVALVCREGFTPTAYSFLCSEHFDEDAFQYQPFTGRRQVKPDAVPSKITITPNKPARQRTSNRLGSCKMATYCAARGCLNRQLKRSRMGSNKRTDDVTFHRFPMKNSLLLQKWVAVLQRENFKPSVHSRLCSKHFLPSDYEKSCFRRKLKKGAVPSLFECPKHLQCKPVLASRRTLVRRPQPNITNVASSPVSVAKAESQKEFKEAVMHDHEYFTTEQTVGKPITETKAHIGVMKTKVKKTKQKVDRKVRVQKRLKEIITDLKNRHLIEDADREMLEDAFGGISVFLSQHMLYNSRRCTSKIKSFIITLHYLSPRAYDYIHPILSLPHPSTLRKWRSTVSCQPGYLDDMIIAASKKAAEKKGDNICSLIIDEMSICKDTSSSHCYSSCLDYGGGPIEYTVASNALLFMLCSLKGTWKVPMAYFLTTDHTEGDRLSQDILQAILKAGDHGLLVKTVVADGLKVNLKAAKLLGCSFDILQFKPYFIHPHPRFPHEMVYYMFDPLHMLKQVRNLLAEGIIQGKTLDGTEVISWSFIRLLQDLQEKESVYLASKIRDRHVNYTDVVMKVNIAAPVLSASVATAIDYLREDLKLPQFEGSEATCQFIRFFDTLFDLLSAKNPLAKGFKAPLSISNRERWEKFLTYAPSYLMSLQSPSGQPLYQGQRGQAITGFLVTAQSTLLLAQELLETAGFKYLLPYKFSQDHIEIFFSKIRQLNGQTSNPTSEQFRIALRTLMMENEVKSSTQANDTALVGTQELQLTSSSSCQKPVHGLGDPADWELMNVASKLESPLMQDSEWRLSCIVYMAGFVCRSLEKFLTCNECTTALFSTQGTTEDAKYAFLYRCNSGNLRVPSEGVVQVLITAEKAFRLLIPSPQLMVNLPCIRMIDLRMQVLVLSYLNDKVVNLFPTLADHFFDHEIIVEENHVSQLVRHIVSCYLHIKMLRAGKLHHQRTILQGASSKRVKHHKRVFFNVE